MDKLLNQQERHCGLISRFINNTDKTIGLDKQSIDFLEARIQLLDSYWNLFVKNNDLLYDGGDLDFLKNDYFKKDTYATIEHDYTEALGELRGRLRKLKLEITETSLNSSRDQSTLNLDTIPKLPKISIPAFNGDYLEWPTFRDLYNSLIHNNRGMPDVQKFYYLKSSLSGEAQKLINHITVTDANYASAWCILTTRYENSRILVNSYISTIMSLRTMTSESSSEIKRLLDTTTQALGALKNLRRPIDQWDDWLVYVVAQKLDSQTRRDWEESLSADIPNFHSMKIFLENRLRTLEAIKLNTSENKPKFTFSRPTYTSRAHVSTTPAKRCLMCSGKHLLIFCPTFRAKTVEQRRIFVREKNLCFNCLRADHSVYHCTISARCKHCKQAHHTMLHQSAPVYSHTVNDPPQNEFQPCTAPIVNRLQMYQDKPTVAHTSTHSTLPKVSILLATAKVLVRSHSGVTKSIRALLDQGSESTFISNSVAQSLQLTRRRVNIPILGIGGCEAGLASSQANFDILPLKDQTISFNTSALVLPNLSSLLPTTRVKAEHWTHIQGLELADPNFAIPSPIDMIIGADLYAQLILNGIRRGLPGTPIAQRTYLGWILSGPCNSVDTQHCVSSIAFHLRLGDDVNSILRRFWEIEERPSKAISTPEEIECENTFQQTVKRNSSGRYIVRLPFKANHPNLGATRHGAVAALIRMEKQFSKNPDLRIQYTTFMEEYLKLGHMKPVADEEMSIPYTQHYYLPHHGVVKPSSTSTQLRVVFNGSYRSATGTSLNDCLHIGPKVQQDLSTIILRWRMYPFVYTADIEKMYRQVLIDDADTNFQRIVWRSSDCSTIKDYKLVTVTYGTSSAPFLACRTLNQLAYDQQKNNPLGSDIILNHFYVDDVLFGAYDICAAKQARIELNRLLQSGGFNLRKWCSNHEELLMTIPEEERELSTCLRVFYDTEVKALGIYWQPSTDVFRFTVQLNTRQNTCSKRAILSDISKLFDPLGWLAPVVVVGKIFLQKLWLAKLDWDDDLPADLYSEWTKYKTDLKDLEGIRINRWLGTPNKETPIEIHGFSDASTLAYSAVIYLRILHNIDCAQISLIACKTKVAPLKTISLPRLELCGAALLARLLKSVLDSMKLDSVPVYLWTDSTIVLAWLKGHPAQWKTFIANRVSEIQTILPEANWRFICTHDNPADCATRGLRPQELKTFSLWWNGPNWLALHSTKWPTETAKTTSDEVPERNEKVLSNATQIAQPWDLLTKYSSLQKLLNVTAWCLIFVHNCKLSLRPTISALSPTDCDKALTFWIKHIQHLAFSDEIRKITAGLPVPRKSKLLSLNPMLDVNQVLRVGGRLQHAFISYSEAHPIILPSDTYFTTLLIQEAHRKTLHGGAQLTLQYIRTKYWIINARNKVRSYIHQCVRCIRYRSHNHNQIMGDLPASRITPSKPFDNTGVDYAGPFSVTPLKSRGVKSFKAYIAVFICFSTRAIHIELVTQLTSEAFIAALRRFMARRGRCSHIYSDNGTNFVGAATSLTKEFQEALQFFEQPIRDALLQDHTTWHFIPPSSPHVGGLWEAGVKSMKHHLRRIIGSTILTIEEMTTLLAQVEACLNSRPLCPLTDDPEDLAVLTPGHFLMGGAPLTVPGPSILDCSLTSLSRWKLVQAMLQHFWERWHKEYLHHLQQRRKWSERQPTIKLNDLVLIKDDHLPPCKWMLARVIEIYPGTDNITRVVMLKHKNGQIKRHINKLCILPQS